MVTEAVVVVLFVYKYVFVYVCVYVDCAFLMFDCPFFDIISAHSRGDVKLQLMCNSCV